MRIQCCPPEKKGGALATPKKGGTVGRSSGAGKGLRGSKGKAKSKNPMADVECEDEIEEHPQDVHCSSNTRARQHSRASFSML